MMRSLAPALIRPTPLALACLLGGLALGGCSGCDKELPGDGGAPLSVPAHDEGSASDGGFLDDAGTWGGSPDAGVPDAGVDWEVPQTRALAFIDSPSLFMGAMPIGTFKAVLGEAELEVTDCYQYAIERQPAYPRGLDQLLLLAGTIKVDVEVGPSGVVERAAINKSSASLDGVMQRCVRRAVERLRWPAASATTLATFSVRFTQEPIDDLDRVAPPGAIAPVTLPTPH